MPRTVNLLAPAKINLFLQILGKRPDGYHEIYSLLQAIDLFDEISVSERPSGISMTCDDPSLPSDSRNIAWRAAELIMSRTSLNRGVEISLTKRIPYGAGLGGGSSDAASVLKGINRLYDLRIPNSQLAEWSAELGSDVPFFFSTGSALVSGRGESVENVDIYSQYSIILVVPDFQISTKDAYESLRFYLTKFSDKTHINLKVSGAEFFKNLNLVGNDFQKFAAANHPELDNCLHVLQRGGADHFALSGSGSAFFGIFEKKPGSGVFDLLSQRFRWRVYSLRPVNLSDF